MVSGLFAIFVLSRVAVLQYRRLHQAKALAESTSRHKTEFLAAMSHEIRTPMNAILGMSDMLAESQLDAEQMQYVDVFRRAGKTALLINDILDLSKIEAGNLELERVEFGGRCSGSGHRVSCCEGPCQRHSAAVASVARHRDCSLMGDLLVETSPDQLTRERGQVHRFGGSRVDRPQPCVR